MAGLIACVRQKGPDDMDTIDAGVAVLEWERL